MPLFNIIKHIIAYIIPLYNCGKGGVNVLKGALDPETVITMYKVEVTLPMQNRKAEVCSIMTGRQPLSTAAG